MTRFLIALALVSLAGCDSLRNDTGAFDLRLTGSRTVTLSGDAYVGQSASAPGGAEITLADVNSSATITIGLPGAPLEGVYDISRDEATVRYSPGILADAYRGVDGTVVLDEVDGDVRGRLEASAALFGTGPVVEIDGTFRSVRR